MEENKTNATEETAEAQCEATPEKKSKKKKDSELTEKIAALEAEIKERDDKYMRLYAEYENFRRRSREEKDATYDIATSDTVSNLLPIIDNLERAMSFDGEKVREGLVMIDKAVSEVLSKLGIEAFGKTGDTFDPNIHNAVMHIEDDSFGEGEIVEVFQKGYKKGSRIIRFAMVKTAN
jgi:molecular chaperone GrpE